MTNPSLTPNVRIESPVARKAIGDVLGYGTLGLSVATLVDLNVPAIDIAWVTVPAAGILAGLLALFQVIVTSANVPSSPDKANSV